MTTTDAVLMRWLGRELLLTGAVRLPSAPAVPVFARETVRPGKGRAS